MTDPSVPSGGDSRFVREAIGSWLREQRLFLGLSQEDLRRRLERRGVQTAQSTVSRWEKGELAPPGDTLAVLAGVLGTSLAELEERVAVARTRAGALVDVTGRRVRDLVDEADGAAHAGNLPRALALLEAADDLLRLGGDATAGPEEEGALLLRLARAHLALWHLGLARAVLRRLASLEGVPGPVRFQARLQRLVLAEREGDPEEHGLLLAVIRGEIPGLEDPVLKSQALHVVGGTLYVHERYGEAVPVLEEAAESWAALGRLEQSLRARVTLGLCRGASGDPDAGERELRDCLAAARAGGYRETEARALFQLGRVLVYAGRVEEGLGLLDDAAVLARRIDLPELEFAVVFRAWQAARDTGVAVAAVLERRLRRALPGVHPRLPEAAAFRAEAGGSSPGDPEGEEVTP